MSGRTAVTAKGDFWWRALVAVALLSLLLAGALIAGPLAGARSEVGPDALIQEGPELRIGSGQPTQGGRFGTSLAISSDGDTALVGASVEDGGAGAAWVFTRSGGTWDQVGSKLAMPAAASQPGDCGKEEPGEEGGEPGEGSGAGKCRFGISVALSADGSIAVVGASHASNNVGAAWIFTRSGSTWTQAQELTSPTPELESRFGRSVAVSGDGDTVLVGAPMWQGRAWVFTRSGSSWSANGEPLTGTGEEGDGGFGHSVALSADGATALIGAPGGGASQGAAWVFERSGSSWSAPGSKLAGSEPGAEARFGGSVALSGDGSTALVGARGAGSGRGAAWVFGDEGAGWSEQGPALTGEGEQVEGFGTSVALSGTGDTALIGAAHNDGGRGQAWLFERADAAWGAPRLQLAAGAGGRADAWFGSSVALSADGETRLVGDSSDERAGAAWVFGIHPGVEAVTPNRGPSAGGTSVTISGEHLAEATAVRFGQVEVPFTVTSGQTVTAVSPPGLGTVHVTVQTPLGTSATTPLDEFTYTNGKGGGGQGKEEKVGDGKGAGDGGVTGQDGGTPSATGAAVGATTVVLGFGPVTARACGTSLVSKKLSVQSRNLALLKLRGTGSGRCAGKLRLRVKLKLARKHTKLVTIGTAVFSISSGRTLPVRIKLNAAGRRLLKAGHGRLNASLLIVRSAPAPSLARTASVRLTKSAPRKPPAAAR